MKKSWYKLKNPFEFDNKYVAKIAIGEVGSGVRFSVEEFKEDNFLGKDLEDNIKIVARFTGESLSLIKGMCLEDFLNVINIIKKHINMIKSKIIKEFIEMLSKMQIRFNFMNDIQRDDHKDIVSFKTILPKPELINLPHSIIKSINILKDLGIHNYCSIAKDFKKDLLDISFLGEKVELHSQKVLLNHSEKCLVKEREEVIFFDSLTANPWKVKSKQILRSVRNFITEMVLKDIFVSLGIDSYYVYIALILSLLLGN